MRGEYTIAARERHAGVRGYNGHVKIFLDDLRPAPEGWTPARWPDEVIRLLESGVVTELSLDHDLGDVQPLDEDLVGVPLRAQLHELRCERHDAEDVDAELLGEFGATRQRRQLGRMIARSHHFHRMWIECHEHTGDSAFLGGFHRPRDQLLMSAVHSVEHADRQYTTTPVRRYFLEASPSLHNGQPTAPARTGHFRLAMQRGSRSAVGHQGRLHT